MTAEELAELELWYKQEYERILEQEFINNNNL